MSGARLSVLCAFACLLGRVSAEYVPLREHVGATFFDRWAYYGNVDNTTWGNVTFVDAPSAQSKRLTYINEAGNAIIKVDNVTTILPPTLDNPVVNRDSIRLTSLDSYGIGSLLVIDAVHIPYGCSVWPSFWTYGMQEEWPGAGEIDVIEAINNMDHNQIALHTPNGCFQGANPLQSGSTLETNCTTPRGCIVAENKPNSFGEGFALAGGGVYAVQMESFGFNVWFWSRPDVPANLVASTSTETIDTTTWGTPTAAYPNTGCDLAKYFPPQNLVLLTSLCGVWAGVPDIYRSTCKTSTGSCYNDNVVGVGSKFDKAYWEIRYIRTYISDALPFPSSSSSSTVEPTATSTPGVNLPASSTNVTTDVTTTKKSSANTLSQLSFQAGIYAIFSLIFAMGVFL